MQAGPGNSGSGSDLAEAVTAALEQPRVLDLVGGMGDRPADLAARGFGHSAGVGGAFGGEGAFHLGEQGQQQEGDPAHALIGRVDRQRVSQGPHPDAPPGEVVHEVEDLAQVAADPVQGVHHDRVAGPGVAQQLVQAVAVDGGPGLLVGVDALAGDARRGERVELAVQGLPDGRDAGVAEVEPALRMIVTGWHAANRTGIRLRTLFPGRVLRDDFRNAACPLVPVSAAAGARPGEIVITGHLERAAVIADVDCRA